MNKLKSASVCVKAPYQVGAIANFMIGLSLRKNNQLTHLKLQKLVYVSYGIYLAKHGEKLFNERIEAWPYGPVIPELYHEFKRFGPVKIDRWSSNFDYETGRFDFPIVSDKDHKTLSVLGFTWGNYAPLSSSVLVDITHTKGGPWHKTITAGKRIVEDNIIRDHYVEILNIWKRREENVRT